MRSREANQPPNRDQELREFANQVQKAAAHCPHKYTDRVWIADAWRAFRGTEECSLSVFKARVIEAHKRNLLVLERCEQISPKEGSIANESATSEGRGRTRWHFVYRYFRDENSVWDGVVPGLQWAGERENKIFPLLMLVLLGIMLFLLSLFAGGE